MSRAIPRSSSRRWSLELWRVTKDGRHYRCESEEHPRYCAYGLKQDELKAGWIEDGRSVR
jgi:hypothetical protein